MSFVAILEIIQTMNYELVQDRYLNIYTAEGRDQSCSTHFHKKVELLYNVEGEKTIHVNNRLYRLEPDNMSIVDSYSLHHYEFSTGCQSLLILPVTDCEHYFTHRKDKMLKTNVIDDPEYCKKEILPYFNRILHFTELDAFTLQANIDMLFANICNKVGLEPSSGSFELESMDTILAYIEQNYDKELTLTSLAKHFGYSKYYFSRIFNDMFRTSLNDYLSVIRLEKALTYQKKHKCSITTAALNNGFGSMPTFYRALKKHYGEISEK